MLVECSVRAGGARFITTRLLASPVQSFLSKAVDFSLAFPFSSISTYRTSQSQPYRVCQTWLQRGRSELRASEVESALWPPASPLCFSISHLHPEVDITSPSSWWQMIMTLLAFISATTFFRELTSESS